MVVLIATIVLIASFLGIVFIVLKKFPLLAQLPKSEIVSEPFWARMKNKIRPANLAKNLPVENFLQKLLSKLRIITLKFEGKTAHWLQELRRRSLRKKDFKTDNYWGKIKDKTEQKDGESTGE